MTLNACLCPAGREWQSFLVPLGELRSHQAAFEVSLHKETMCLVPEEPLRADHSLFMMDELSSLCLSLSAHIISSREGVPWLSGKALHNHHQRTEWLPHLAWAPISTPLGLDLSPGKNLNTQTKLSSCLQVKIQLNQLSGAGHGGIERGARERFWPQYLEQGTHLNTHQNKAAQGTGPLK